MAVIGKMAAIGEEIHSSRQVQLTDLPDEILIRILSMLPTKDAVRTCLLVLRRNGQQHLWKYLTRLEFREDYMDFLRGSHFKNFVDRVMDLRDHSVPLVSLCLHVEMEEETEAYSNRIKTWITKAVECNVEELTFSINDDYTKSRPFLPCLPCLPCCIFGCHSLVKLDLEYFPPVQFEVQSSVICLPRLKHLRLIHVHFHGDESTEKLLSSPQLETLIIDRCEWADIGSIRVCSPKLKVLEIKRDGKDKTRICIIGDSLQYFSYDGDLINEYRICASSSMQLSKVEIYVDRYTLKRFAVNNYEILKGLSGTRNLALSDYFLEGLQRFSELLDTIPVFKCLTRLNIQVYKKAVCVDSLALMKMYERCPYLECLNIGKLSHVGGSQQLCPVPLCFQTHLKKILVHYYVPGGRKADAAIDVLLNSAFVLEELVIYCTRNEKKGFHEGGRKIQELQDRLNLRPRVSKDCVISVRVTCDTGFDDWDMPLFFYWDCYRNSMKA